MFARLWKDCGHVSAESVLSGPGLVRLARAPRSAGDLARGRNHRRGRARTRAVGAGGDAFVRAPARALCRRLALTFKALGGVYIAGGVAGGLGPLLDEPQFRAAFEAHPPYQALLETIPTLLMTCEEPGLIGCGVLANEQAVTA